MEGGVQIVIAMKSIHSKIITTESIKEKYCKKINIFVQKLTYELNTLFCNLLISAVDFLYC